MRSGTLLFVQDNMLLIARCVDGNTTVQNITQNVAEYAEVSIERIFVKEDTGRVEYTKNPDTYVPLEDVSEKDMQNVYNSFEQYYLDRIKEKQAENHKESIESRG